MALGQQLSLSDTSTFAKTPHTTLSLYRYHIWYTMIDSLSLSRSYFATENSLSITQQRTHYYREITLPLCLSDLRCVYTIPTLSRLPLSHCASNNAEYSVCDIWYVIIEKISLYLSIIFGM